MATQDWKKTYEEPEEIIWTNKKNGNEFAITKTFAQEWTSGINKGNGWESVPTGGFENKYLKNKTIALAFARSYMRTH